MENHSNHQIGEIDKLNIDHSLQSTHSRNIKPDGMAIPRFYNLVKFVAQFGALFVCLIGVVGIIGEMSSFKFGLMIGIGAIGWGVATIIGSLAASGAAYCFLASVRAQIEARNAIILYTSRTRS